MAYKPPRLNKSSPLTEQKKMLLFNTVIKYSSVNKRCLMLGKSLYKSPSAYTLCHFDMHECKWAISGHPHWAMRWDFLCDWHLVRGIQTWWEWMQRSIITYMYFRKSKKWRCAGVPFLICKPWNIVVTVRLIELKSLVWTGDMWRKTLFIFEINHTLLHRQPRHLRLSLTHFFAAGDLGRWFSSHSRQILTLAYDFDWLVDFGWWSLRLIFATVFRYFSSWH